MFPTNILIRKIQPQRMLGGAVITFGVLVVCLSAAESYGAVLALRILIGCFQSWVQATSVYIPYWYQRDEVASRGGKLTLYDTMWDGSLIYILSFILFCRNAFGGIQRPSCVWNSA